ARICGAGRRACVELCQLFDDGPAQLTTMFENRLEDADEGLEARQLTDGLCKTEEAAEHERLRDHDRVRLRRPRARETAPRDGHRSRIRFDRDGHALVDRSIC